MKANKTASLEHKPKNFKRSLFQLAKYSKPYIVAIIIALILDITGTVLVVFTPNLLGDMTNVVSNSFILGIEIDLVEVCRLGTILAIFFGTRYICTIAESLIMSNVTTRLTKRFRRDISQKINRLPLKYFDSRTYGDIMSRITNDVDTIAANLGSSVTQFITSVTMFIGVGIMMFTISWQMALAAIGVVVISSCLSPLIILASQKHFRAQQQTLGQLNGNIEEIYSAHNIVKVFNAEEKTTKAFDEINNTLYKSAWKSQFLSGLMMPLMGFIGNLSFILVCVLGGHLFLGGMLTIGAIQSFIIYIRQFNMPISQIASIASTLQQTAAASERVFEFLNEKEQEDESYKVTKLEKVKGAVEFKNVCFGYDENKEIIHNFSCSIKPGAKVAIVGPTGAGKTTLVNLLMRFYEVNSGKIEIDGVNIQELTRENVRNLFGMVLQDTWLFDGTIKENLQYANDNATLEDIINACEAAHIDHFIKTLPNGYDHELNEGSSVSQGERQLLTIARAMVENAPMLILDEATSSVDTRTEVRIQSAMDKLSKGRTSFVIAHRLSTIKNADLILVMKDGNIVEKGNHKELLEANGFYAELYNSQFAPV